MYNLSKLEVEWFKVVDLNILDIVLNTPQNPTKSLRKDRRLLCYQVIILITLSKMAVC